MLLVFYLRNHGLTQVVKIYSYVFFQEFNCFSSLIDHTSSSSVLEYLSFQKHKYLNQRNHANGGISASSEVGEGRY